MLAFNVNDGAGFQACLEAGVNAAASWFFTAPAQAPAEQPDDRRFMVLPLSARTPAALLQSADLAIGHVEVPHTARGVEQSTDIPAPPADPAHLDALPRAGFGVITLAGNHIADSGPAGIEDTVARLRELGLAPSAETEELAARILVNAPLTVRGAKEMVRMATEMGRTAALRASHRAFDAVYLSEDAIEGPRSFREKRKPQWKGQ